MSLLIVVCFNCFFCGMSLAAALFMAISKDYGGVALNIMLVMLNGALGIHNACKLYALLPILTEAIK